MRDRTFTPIGSYIPLPVARPVPPVVQDGIFVDRRNGTPMEMDAYSLYLALKACGDHDSLADRRYIVERIEARRIAANGFWHHGVWAPHVSEIHLRFTAAAIRLLIEAHTDGIYPDGTQLAAILRRHCDYREQLAFGPWFLHDTLELHEHAAAALEQPYVTELWRSSSSNCLVLNTHVDTLSTLLDALDRVVMPEADQAALTRLADEALGTLFAVLDAPVPWWWNSLSLVDSAARGLLLRNPKPRTRLGNIVKWRLIIGIYYKARRALKARAGRFDFSDGYLERDLTLSGYHFDYHVYNLHDLLRLIRIADRSGRITHEQRARLIAIVDAGLNYACREPYARFVRASYQENGRAGVLREAIMSRATLTTGFAMPAAWRVLADEINEQVPPTPAMLGYDPFIVPEHKAPVLSDVSSAAI